MSVLTARLEKAGARTAVSTPHATNSPFKHTDREAIGERRGRVDRGVDRALSRAARARSGGAGQREAGGQAAVSGGLPVARRLDDRRRATLY